MLKQPYESPLFDENLNSPPKTQPKSQHFDTAYRNLLHQLKAPASSEEEALIHRLLLNPEAEENFAKEEFFSKKYQNHSSMRLSNNFNELKAKHQKLAEDFLQKELKECSFNPEILVNKDSERQRSLPEFLASQQKFILQKNEKIELLRSHLNARNLEKTSKPQLCEESLEILKKNGKNAKDLPVYERLYSLNKKVKNLDKEESFEEKPKNDDFFAKEKEKNPAENVTFTPKINEKSKAILLRLPREKKADIRLYEDFFTRQKKILVKREENKPKLGFPQNLSISSKKISKKLIADAFMKEFAEISLNFMINDQDSKFEYLSICEILKLLGFITNCENLSGGLFEKERTLLFELWWALKGQEFLGVNYRNLCLFLLAILGLNAKIPKEKVKDGFSAKALPKDEHKVNFDEEKAGFKLTKTLKAEILNEEKLENSSKKLALGSIVNVNNEGFYQQWAILNEGKIYGKYDNLGDLELEPKDIEEIQRKFELFYRNRLSNEVLKKANPEEKPTFMPNILMNSKILASGHREKLMEKTQEFLKKQDLEGKIPENGNFSHADLLILSREAAILENSRKAASHDEEMKECTFRPKLLNSSNSERKIDRNLELFGLSKNKIKGKARDLKDIEYEKNCSECTFQPDLKKNTKEIGSSRVYAKNIDKFITRMKNSQKEREYVNMWTKSEERGFPGKRKEDCEEKDENFGREFEEKLSIFKENSNFEKNSRFQDEEKNEHNFNENLERMPMLFVDVNIGPNRTERIIVNEGDRSEDLADKFATEFSLFFFFFIDFFYFF